MLSPRKDLAVEETMPGMRSFFCGKSLGQNIGKMEICWNNSKSSLKLMWQENMNDFSNWSGWHVSNTTIQIEGFWIYISHHDLFTYSNARTLSFQKTTLHEATWANDVHNRNDTLSSPTCFRHFPNALGATPTMENPPAMQWWHWSPRIDSKRPEASEVWEVVKLT